MRLIRRHGQSIGEYAILLGIVLGAIFAAQNYIRKGIAGAVKGQANQYAAEGDAVDPKLKFDSTSDSASATDADFTTDADGKVTTRTKGESTITNPTFE